jgi:Tfp pilus assembly protein PilF
VYASANAALAAAQLGDEEAAEREFRAVARRAPNSADMRAALAALLYSSGRIAEAEEQWEQACTRNVGCGRYRDLDYVRRVRRWPPVMVEKLETFLSVR